MTVQTRQIMKYSHTIGLSTMSGRGFYYPVDTAIGEDDRLYTVSRSLDGDPRGIRVTIYDLDSEYFGTFSEYGEGDGQFIWPTGITRDPQGRTYVSDEFTNRITVFDQQGDYSHSWGTTGTGAGEIDGPSAIAFDSDENLLVVDHQNHRIQRYSQNGIFLSEFGSRGSGDGEFDLPWGITVSSAGDIYVADWHNDRIQRFSTGGNYIASYGESGRGDGQLFRPSSVAVDALGFVYVADWGNERVQIFDTEGGFVQTLRGEATDSKWAEAFLEINLEEAAARDNSNLEPDIEFFNDDPHEESSHIEKYFWAPTSVKLDSKGRMYVTESNRHRVQIYEKA
jgi:DNA-binding beta-propeller fold protein YncE